ncbi:DUF2254 domain-containing protein [Altererythrobacter sp. N1]|nr:DUF2254 domain-containing protein [Altererythrobacter sp. N1]
MTAQIRWLWSRLNANYWFYPALFSVFSAVLAFTLIWLDRNGFADWLNTMSIIVPARPDGATNMLSVIAGSMIGTAATVFSITIAAVAYASGNYGPRLLTNFMEDKGNQLSLATFISTFVYSIIVLRSVRAEDEVAANATDAASTALPGFVPQLSLLVAFALMAISVAVLVFFLNHIPSSIRINTVLEGIGERLLKQVRSEFPERSCEAEPDEQPGGQPLRAAGTGYVQMIDFEELSEIAEEHGCAISLKVRTGDFVHPGVTLAELDGDEPDEELTEKLHSALILGATRTPKQDPDFLIDELVEIALRALSPGINDPFTAITALHWLGAATAELGQRDLRKNAREEADKKWVYPLPDGFAHFVRRGFGAVRSAVATSPRASLVMFDVLANAASTIDEEYRVDLLRGEAALLLEQARTALQGPDLQDVEDRHADFRARFG